MVELWAGRGAARRRGEPLSGPSGSRMLVVGYKDHVSTFALALFGLLLGSYLLSTRYHTSAAFERPFHLCFATFIIHVAFLSILRPHIVREARQASTKDHDSHLPLTAYGEGRKAFNSPSGSLPITLRELLKVPSTGLIVGGLAARSIAFWYITTTPQCSELGLETFRVLFMYALELNERRELRQRGPSSNFDVVASVDAWPRWKTATYIKFALSWALAATKALPAAQTSTADVCPNVWWYDPLVPALQIFTCAIDAYLIRSLNRIRHTFLQKGRDYSTTLTGFSILGAASIVFLSIPSWADDRNFFWAMTFRYTDIKDLIFDGSLIAGAMCCGFHLLAVLSPSTVLLAVTSLTMFGIHIPYLGLGPSLPPMNMEDVKWKMLFAAFSATPMWLLLRPPVANPRPAMTAVVHRWLVLCYAGVLALCFAFWLLRPAIPAPEWSMKGAVDELTRMGRSYSTTWQAQAAHSESLESAVSEYRRRYGIPPPQNFDKWYEFAVENKSPIIDDFGQIHEDLLPFWGMRPSEIRERTFEVQRYSAVEMVGLRIRSGAVHKSPHIHPSHQWMMDSVERMVEPFAHWLPDMDLAINVADEPRVALRYQDMQLIEAKASETRGRLQRNADSKTFDKGPSTQWPAEFPKPAGAEGSMDLPQGFTNYIRKPILNDLVADSCPPGSLIQSSRWWDASTSCTSCQLPHSFITKSGAIVLNDTLASDLCHQPDAGRLAGSVSSPSAMFATRQLSPVFSQGRLSGFSDILMPSPWNFDDLSSYDDAKDMDWSDKTNSIFWRGGLTDGYAAEGSWTGFTRARFVHEAYQNAKTLKGDSAMRINVSFSGEMTRCHNADCKAELQTFNKWAGQAMPGGAIVESVGSKKQTLPSLIPFTEHWRFRHLMDMDGAGFSGRFLPFLRSRSLVYRAALYHTWMDERVHAWRHYIPVDIRLGHGFWKLLGYLSGAQGHGGGGDVVARDVAEQGRRWASEALRKEDMQVYMFRLLLEWGRIVDDDREHSFYTR
ncbi:glycosyl transferase family 90 domain-containing protein [Sarocladium implicatum]|nr:glycosyl transferase family 90 domain-containing protein [Sarocladium implicatum]